MLIGYFVIMWVSIFILLGYFCLKFDILEVNFVKNLFYQYNF